jgi:hypothetical protein
MRKQVDGQNEQVAEAHSSGRVRHRSTAAGSLSVDELLRQYCRWVYAQTGTYEATAERLGVDRRTVRHSDQEGAEAKSLKIQGAAPSIAMNNR